MKRLFLLPIAPCLLPRAARETGDALAHRTGLGVTVWLVAYALSIAGAAGDEPISSFGDYLASAFGFSLTGTILTLPLWHPRALLLPFLA